MKEIPFKNSSLESTILQAKETDIHYSWIQRAFSKQPESIFWKDAFQMISKKHLKTRK